MAAANHRDQVLETLRLSTTPMDDDQLSRRTGIAPRQTINQLCRALEADGRVRRYVSADGKIVNELIQHGPRATEPATEQQRSALEDHEAGPLTITKEPLPQGNSQEQRDAEHAMLDLLTEQLGVALTPQRISLSSGVRVEVDGADADKTVLVECWAHQGRPKSAQRHKVLADALKLVWVASTIYPRPRLYLCLSDDEAARSFSPGARTWAAQALHDLGVTVFVVTLPASLREQIVAAQKRQYR